MSSIQTISSEPLRRHRLTVDNYYKMGKAGVFKEKDRVELIEGEIIDMIPIGSNHAYTINKILNHFLMKQLSNDAIVRIQDPLRLDQYNEPEPDLTLVTNKNYFTRHPGPEDTLLVVEVSDSSLNYDIDIKVPLYARHAIPEVWVIDLNDRLIQVFQQPQDGIFQQKNTFKSGAITPVQVSSFILNIDELWND